MGESRMTRLRRFSGVLAGTALSSTGIAACLGLTWLRRNHLGGGNADGPTMAIAVVAAASAALLAVTALLLLRKSTPDLRITNVLTASAVSVSLVPLEVALLKETRAVFVSTALLPILVLLALSRSRLGSFSTADSLELARGGLAGKAGTMQVAPLWPAGDNGDGRASWTSDYEIAARGRRQGRNGARAPARGTVVDMNRDTGDGKRQRRTSHFRRDARCIWDSKQYAAKRRASPHRPGGRPYALRPVEQAANAREDSNGLSEHVAALSEELECSIERLDRLCAAIDVRRETPTPTPRDTSPVVASGASDLSEALTSMVGRLDALCERLEPCVDRLERFADSVDGRIDESTSPGRETTESTGPSPPEEAGLPASVPGELGAFREQVEGLVSGLRQAPGDREPDVELQVIRSLRKRLGDFLQKLEEEKKRP